jgi:hypothetical protein
MKNTFWMLTLAVFLLPACGGTENDTNGGNQAYSKDVYGTTYQPELVTPQYDQAMNVNSALRVALELSETQMTNCLSNVVHVIEQQVDTCPDKYGMCLPGMSVCTNDGNCYSGTGPSAGTFTMTSATLTVYEKTGSSCYFDIEYGMNLGYLLSVCKHGGFVNQSLGNFPEVQTVNNTLRGMGLCSK